MTTKLNAPLKTSQSHQQRPAGAARANTQMAGSARRSKAGPAQAVLKLTGMPETAEPSPTVGGCKGLQQEGKFVWIVELGAARNYEKLGSRLAASGDLYRHHQGHALLQVLPEGQPRLISKGGQLAPVIVDRIKMIVTKEGKIVSELPTTAHLNAILRSETFLG